MRANQSRVLRSSKASVDICGISSSVLYRKLLSTLSHAGSPEFRKGSNITVQNMLKLFPKYLKHVETTSFNLCSRSSILGEHYNLGTSCPTVSGDSQINCWHHCRSVERKHLSQSGLVTLLVGGYWDCCDISPPLPYPDISWPSLRSWR